MKTFCGCWNHRCSNDFQPSGIFFDKNTVYVGWNKKKVRKKICIISIINMCSDSVKRARISDNETLIE